MFCRLSANYINVYAVDIFSVLVRVANLVDDLCIAAFVVFTKRQQVTKYSRANVIFPENSDNLLLD